MQELLRTNDVVLLSFVRSVLEDHGIEATVLDSHMSVVEGSLGILPRRLMVSDKDATRARALVEESTRTASPSAENVATPELTDDAFLGGRVRVRQPRAGFRAAIDSVVLAAAVAAETGETALEAGTGAGVAALCLLARVPGLEVTAVEIQPALAALARENAARNGQNGALEIVNADFVSSSAALAIREFDHFFCNPPFHVEGEGTKAPMAAKDTAQRGDRRTLAVWLDAGLRRLRPAGRLTLIDKPETLPAILAALEGRAGAIALFPLWPRSGKPARRILVSAVKGSRAPLRILSGLVMHGPGQAFTPEAEEVLRNGRAIEWNE